ncbi:hypothetical protein OBBRIDRAFT_702884, partial [Obba rivulosa]
MPPRSSLVNHTFPPFYACYLLKSIQFPTYIGSTPNPSRRLRQHNGEISQGASKTQGRRPWVMHMIVYGFPSKLSALQFEWAWQHPNRSRHLRGLTIVQARNFTARVLAARGMISSHPYNTWPLHVKLFTVEAVKAWQRALVVYKSPLPPGFKCEEELEGVNGKSGCVGSGRAGPIEADDAALPAAFTVSQLDKMTSILASHNQLSCSICHSAVDPKPLTTALCPNPDCTAISHLTCLSSDFLAHEHNNHRLIPRGGECRRCRSYILWGDVVR